MTRRDFDRHLKALQDEVLILGSMVGKAIHLSTEALRNRDLDLAGQVIKGDESINQKRFEIEEQCIHLIATQQPMAVDLRIIIAVLNIIVDLERIGDHASGNASIAVMLGDEPPLKPYVDIPRMSQETVEMLNSGLESFIKRDAVRAREVCAEDDQVDNLYNQVFRELLTYMAEDPRTINRATRLIWVAHNLERSADRVTNICERVIFVVTGKLEEVASKY